ncbi:MAG: T9SS type A sorting domain-containing protein [Saprospiraceae bacterium]|nr:T9SS type A sorting domain-containing protein [Saprospiraceae bacterium]
MDRISGGYTDISDVEKNSSNERFYLLKSVVDSVWVNDQLAISGPFSDSIYGATYLLTVKSDGSVGFIENFRFNFGDLVIGDTSLCVFISFINDTLWISNTYFVNSAPFPGHNMLALEYNYSGDLINFKHWNSDKNSSLLIEKVIFLNGDFYLAGECYKDSLILDNHFVVPDIGNGDIFIAKIDNLFEVMWLADFGHKGNDYVRDIFCNDNGNVLFTGEFGSNYIFCDSDTLFNDWALFNTVDMVVGELNTYGQCEWMRQIKDMASVYGIGSAILSDGQVVVSGNYEGLNADFGDTLLINPSEFSNGFLANYTFSGELLNVHQFGGGKTTVNQGFSISDSDDIWSSGYFESDSLVVGDTIFNSNGGLDAYLLRYTEFGLPMDWYVFGGSGNDYFTTMNRCDNGDILAVLLSNSDTIMIGNEIYTSSPNWVNIYILSIDENSTSILSPTQSKNQLIIYPNPIGSSGIIKYQLDPDSEVNGRFYLFSFDGSLLKKWDVFNDVGELNVSDVFSGVYFLRFIDSRGNTEVNKILIK